MNADNPIFFFDKQAEKYILLIKPMSIQAGEQQGESL